MAHLDSKHAWQLEREMSALQFREILGDLGLSQAAVGRFLDLSPATIARYRRGAARIPTGYAMLLRAVRDLGVQLVVPPKTDPRKHW